MPWIKDYFAVCSKCHNQEWMDGRTVREAERYARKNGWSVNPLVCPNCRGSLTKRALDGGRRPAQFTDSSLEVINGKAYPRRRK